MDEARPSWNLSDLAMSDGLDKQVLQGTNGLLSPACRPPRIVGRSQRISQVTEVLDGQNSCYGVLGMARVDGRYAIHDFRFENR